MSIHVGSCVLVTGETFAKKDELKAIGGGQWNKTLEGWIFPEEKRDEVVKALGSDVAPPGTPKPEKPPPKPSVDAHAKLTIAPYKKSIVVTGTQFGDTQIKDALKSIKGSWNKSLSGWVFQGTRKDEVVAFLRQDATNTVTVVDTPYEPPAKKQKTDAFINDDDSD